MSESSAVEINGGQLQLAEAHAQLAAKDEQLEAKDTELQQLRVQLARFEGVPPQPE